MRETTERQFNCSQSVLGDDDRLHDDKSTSEDRLLNGYSLSSDSNLELSSTSPRHSFPKWVLVANLSIFVLSLLVFAVSAFMLSEVREAYGMNWLLKATSNPSPLLDQINIPLINKRMNGSLLDIEPKDIYRQSPSPEVDAAWERIQTRDPIPISREDVIRLGKDPNDVAKFPESFGYGKEAYIGKVDVFHQIHCLNTLRKNLRNNFAYYFGDQFPGDTPTDRFTDLHVSHCISAILQNLMCSGNVDLYTHRWIDAQIHAFPDFNIDHKCRDFDAILAWQEEHAVPVEKFAEVRAPEDYKVHIMSHEFKEALHWYDNHPDDGVVDGEAA
ncbi:hypothetical protein BGZ63DRAFT_506579 [Mariannaea sp. PMI_226]|nr:hypothetical protein BGZ63DRAFT_506579 [Mariannaea sp. PMI_226]